MKIGEEKEINVTFPKEYHAENLAGKPAMFKVKLISIKFYLNLMMSLQKMFLNLKL